MESMIRNRALQSPPAISSALIAMFMLLTAPHISRSENVAITFDDLPLNGQLAPNMTRAGIVKDVLIILKDRRIPQVYGFVNAQRFEGNTDGAEALKLWVAGGQRVANHTYAHFDLSTVTPDTFMEDVRRNEPVLELLDSSENWRWFRYPYLREGDTLEKRRAVRTRLHERGYRIAQVTLDYEDYLWNSAYARCVSKGDGNSVAWLSSSYLTTASQYLDADRQMAKAIFNRDISHVLLLHLGAFSSTILPQLFDLLHQKGFTFVTLEQAQKDAAYETDPDAPSRQGGTLLEQWMDARKLTYPQVPPKPYKALEGVCQ
ncbi:MAG TPA: polysaccharide deacetylase family protein [Steroidobacteraceae bacterium]